MTRILRAILVTGALLGSVLVASTTSNAGAGGAPPPPPESFNELYYSVPMTVNGDFTPIFGLGCDGEDLAPFILWYAPGSAADYLWNVTSIDPLEYTSVPMPVNGTYEPVVEDFDGDECDDILWYGAGTAPDHIWWGEDGLTFTSAPLTINGTFEPVTGHFSEDNGADIFWYAPGTGAEYLWDGQTDRTFSSMVGPSVNGDYEVETIFTSVLFHKPGPGTDYLWTGLNATTGDHGTLPFQINGTYSPQADMNGILLYGPGGAPDYLLYDLDEDGTTYTIPGTINGTYADDVRSSRTFVIHVWHAPGTSPDYLWLPAEFAESSSADAADAMANAEAPEFSGRR